MIQERKSDHVDIVLNNDVSARENWWDRVHLVHRALPEIDMDDIDLAVTLFGAELSMPLVISAMTGGYPRGESINRNLAEAAAEYGVGMGIGSQRAGLEHPDLQSTYSVVKDYDIPLVIGNLGAPQLIPQGDKRAYGADDARQAMDMVGADVLAIHLNFLQEAAQPEGDRNARGCLDAIAEIASEVKVIAKETGAGLSSTDLDALAGTGIVGLDIGGLGGTSFSAVETFRVPMGNPLKRVGTTFWDWGVPSPVTLSLAADRFEVIATGGIRNGLDAAKALAMGAGSAGMAAALLRAATESADAVKTELEAVRAELMTAMFLTGSADIRSLGSTQVILDAEIERWAGAMR